MPLSIARAGKPQRRCDADAPETTPTEPRSVPSNRYNDRDYWKLGRTEQGGAACRDVDTDGA